jgi:hypothetical protein
VVGQVGAAALERAVSGGSEGSGGQLARPSHYIGPVASDALAQSWMHWGDTPAHMVNRQAPQSHELRASQGEGCIRGSGK